MPLAGSNTRSGGVFEKICEPALTENGYEIGSQQTIGAGLGGGKHRVDHYARAENGEMILISVKWQDTAGTVDEKIPFEIIKLLDLLDQSETYQRAVIVLGGDGMRRHLEQYYTDGSIWKWIAGHGSRVRCMTLNQFISACNRKTL